MQKRGLESTKEEKTKQEALKISISEGAASKFAFGIGNNYITPFALALKANSMHIGVLSSLTGLLPQITQYYSNRLMKNNSRKKIVLNFLLLENLLWLPIALVGFLYWQGLIQSYAIYFLIILYTLTTIATGTFYPAWFSWMGDLVPETDRGKYFSKRNLAIGIVELSAVLIGVVLIRAFEKQGLLILGLSIFCIIAFIFKFISYFLIKKQYEPKFLLKEKSELSLREFLKKYTNFKQFVLYQGVFYFALMIASPFFAVYMAEELKFSTATYMAITMCGSVFYLIFLPIIGKFSDKYGNLKLFYIANLAFAISPLLWIVSKNPFFLAIVPQMFIGLANASLTISFVNFSYGSVSPEHRGQGVSYVNIMVGLGVFLGSILGGLILRYAQFQAINIFFVVFILSAVLRGATAYYFLPKIKEEKRFEKAPPISLNLSHPFETIHAKLSSINELSRSRYTEGLKIWEISKSNVLQKKAKE